MLYQLPNGRTINISLKEYLDMSDQELKSLNAMNIGESVSSPFIGSAINSSQKIEVEEEIEDNTPEILSDEDDVNISIRDIDNLADDGLTDFEII